jgi:hypothetical protein
MNIKNKNIFLYKVNHNPLIYMYDTPGVLEPTFEDIETGFKLACLSNLFQFYFQLLFNIFVIYFRLYKKSSG